MWGLGAPTTELWMDNYCIAAGAPNPDAAHAWINWILIPEVSIKDLDYHGYNSGMKNMSQLLNELKPDLKYGDMIFFGDDQVKTMRTQEITSSLRTAWSTSTTRSRPRPAPVLITDGSNEVSVR